MFGNHCFAQVPNKTEQTPHKDLALSVASSPLHPRARDSTFPQVKIYVHGEEIRKIGRFKPINFDKTFTAMIT